MIDMKQLESVAARARKDDEIFGPVNLRRIDPPQKFRPVNPDKIVPAVAEYYHVPAKGILGRGRQRSLFVPRMVAMYLWRAMSNRSYEEVGVAFDRDHSTILHDTKLAVKMIREDDVLYRQVEELEQMIVEKGSAA